MSSQKKIESNRRNAKRSTGPTSTLGKKHSSGNAVTHGYFAMRMVPGEDPKPYRGLLESLMDELQPRGLLEEMHAHEIANDVWRLGRLHRGEHDVLTQLAYAAAYARKILEGDGTQDVEIGDLEVTGEDVDKAMGSCITEHDEVEISERVEAIRQTLLRNIKRKLAVLFTLQERRAVEVLPAKRASEVPADRERDRSGRPAGQMGLF